MFTPEILRIPNLLSLSRVALAPFIGYYLWRSDAHATLLAVILLIVAGITDGLDGYLARRWNQVGKLGTALDPIADKLLAAILVVCLMLYRDMPLWLAAIIVGRDLLIMLLGLLLLGQYKAVVPSNLTGKYAFTAIMLLLTSYVVRFDFGIRVTTYAAVILMAASIFSYGRVFLQVRQGQPVPVFQDMSVYKITRFTVTTVFCVIYLVKLYLDVIR